MTRKRVLLVEKDKNQWSTMAKIFVDSGHLFDTAVDGLSAFKKIRENRYDLVISELDLPRMNGLDLLKQIQQTDQSLPVIMISADSGVTEAVEAMKIGAQDFFMKPLTGKMIEAIASQVCNHSSVAEMDEPNDRYKIITQNREMHRLLKEAKEMAESRASIFIQGESGTGKELFARYIHECSPRKNKAFIAINCAALPATLLESELFGHEKGAFTGAFSRKKGKFEVANHGTMLLDEISEMDYQLQSKLLRVLQEREIDRVGGVAPIPVDVRIIATTNRDIETQIDDGKFREDLYYRLNVIPFNLPPLRKRRDDIPFLTSYFIEKYNRIDSRSVKGLTEKAIQMLIQMPWKGNVRELENKIERAILMCKGDLIDEKDLMLDRSRKGQPEDADYYFPSSIPLKEMEKKAILETLDHTNGNRTHAAEKLGISVRTLRNKLNEYRKKMGEQ